MASPFRAFTIPQIVAYSFGSRFALPSLRRGLSSTRARHVALHCLGQAFADAIPLFGLIFAVFNKAKMTFEIAKHQFFPKSISLPNQALAAKYRLTPSPDKTAPAIPG